jgi:hypothetical protein
VKQAVEALLAANDRDPWGFHHTILFDRFSGDPNAFFALAVAIFTLGSL